MLRQSGKMVVELEPRSFASKILGDVDCQYFLKVVGDVSPVILEEEYEG
jgi:hypothetical protein